MQAKANAFTQIFYSLRGRRLKGKGKGVLGARGVLLGITLAALQSSALPSQLMAGYQVTEKVLCEICRTVMCIKRKACVIEEKDEFRAVKYNK